MENSLPYTLNICSVPMFIRNADAELNAANIVSQSSTFFQYIHVLSTLSVSRQHQILCTEIMWQLLYASGLDKETCENVYQQAGTSLYNTLRDTKFNWVGDISEPFPEFIIVNGMTYNIRFDCNEYLGACGLGGECCYDESCIKIHDGAGNTAKRLIFCHELAHAILNESSCEITNDESIIEPLGRFLYQLLSLNDFTFIRGCNK